MNIGQLSHGRVVRVSESASLSEVARLMCSERVGAVIVTSSNEPDAPMSGLITDRDVVDAQLAHSKDLASLNVRESMTTHVLALVASESIDGAIAHMRARNVRRAPVVSAAGIPVGMISVDDLIRELSVALGSIASIVARQSQPR
jgi:signal-transduction protein with cAMP-binding, CBS, and nucleotidyltransferase domain